MERNSSRVLRVAAIGAGRISEEHLRFLSASPQAVLAAVCDLSSAMAEFAADRFNAESHYTDYKRMLTEVKPDVVHIMTPPHTHTTLIRDCLHADAHVIVEKPIAPSNAEFRELWELARSRGRALLEDHNARFSEPVLAIEKMIAQGRLGDVREVEVRLALPLAGPGSRYNDPNLPHPSHGLPAGALHEFMPHLCYLALRFLPPVDRVGAAWTKHGKSNLFKYDDLDCIVVAGDAHGRIRMTCYQAPDGFSIAVRGTKAWVETDLYHPCLRVVGPRPGGAQLMPLVNHLANGLAYVRASAVGFRNKIIQKNLYEGIHTFLHQTYTALREGTPLPVSFDDMDRSTRLLDDMLRKENQV
ncbi:MAG: Gfo/Idh/MocA family oxidoreductase [Candidatus Hydrogenedentes bacterium]|nr:Gfo/Idh/MocA family oxidoreductase [Candidatus Hydrogenedentota bacterium]